MLMHKSIKHVNQDLGKVISKQDDIIKGYYNNFTEKVTKQPELLRNNTLPVYKTLQGGVVTFPVDVFQYGLGAYDLYLTTYEEKYKEKFLQCCEWAKNNQEYTGAWDNFFFIYPHSPYSAMAQGEGASLLIRGYIEFNNKKYLSAAQKAIDFMLKPVAQGGTTLYKKNGDIFFYEYTHLPLVLNGWVFAIFGLYDMTIFFKDNQKYQQVFLSAEKSLEKTLYKFDAKYWTYYDLGHKLASPFYHKLHIAQMQALYIITKKDIYKQTETLYKKYNKNLLYKSYAFSKKAWQKIIE